MSIRRNIATPFRIFSLGLMVILFHNGNAQTKHENVALPVQPFELVEVQLLDGPFKTAQDIAAQNLLKYYEPASFLARFRPMAGLEPQAEKYNGWETWLMGHSIGHYLSGCALAYAATANEEFRKRIDFIIDDLALIQEKSGSGFLAKPSDKEKFENEIAKGKIESKGFLLNGMNVPLYTMHKIFGGLRDAYRLANNKKALEVEKRFADWIYTQIMHLNDEQFQNILECEHGGIAETFADLYYDTKDEKYLALSKRFFDRKLMTPILNGVDNLAGLHANTQIPKYIGLARITELDGSPREKITAENFWNIVVDHHSYKTGGNSYHEHFSPADKLNDFLDPVTTESCNTYNMLKLSNHLFCWNPHSKISDYTERLILNHSLASQNPENGWVTYYLSLEMPALRDFNDPYSFTCCVGSGMEHHFLYPQLIYFYNEKQLYVNQFIASKLNWSSKGVTCTQTTKFPFGETSEIEIQCAKAMEFSLLIRKPNWIKSEMKALFNGKVIKMELQENGYYALNRKWTNGDKITIEFPFALHTESMPDNANRIAIFNGPILLGAILGAKSSKDAKNPDFVPVLLTKNKPVDEWVIAADKSKSTFKIAQSSFEGELELKPFYELYNCFHTIYWDVFTADEWIKDKRLYLNKITGFKNLEKKTVDFFQPGEMQPERDHSFVGENLTVVEYEGIKGRKAADGWFKFEMIVLPDKPMALVQKYWGNISGDEKVSFDIFVDGELICTRIIHWSGGFFEVTNTLPESLTKGKDKVTIAFKTNKSFQAGPLCGVRMIRTDEDE